MGYYVSNMIGIRTRGTFAGETDIEDMIKRIAGIVKTMRGTDLDPDLADEPSDCISHELKGPKGTYVVIAGVFSFWTFARAGPFAQALSAEFGTEVMIMSWDEEQDEVEWQIYLDGQPLYDNGERRATAVQPTELDPLRKRVQAKDSAMSSALKELGEGPGCPYCKGKMQLRRTRGADPTYAYWQIECKECHARGPSETTYGEALRSFKAAHPEGDSP